MIPNLLAVIVPAGFTEAVDVGDHKRILFYPNGDVRFQHVCDRAHRDAGVIVCAPLLQIGNGHTIVTKKPLTIVASLACADCATHGHVTDGRWVPC